MSECLQWLMETGTDDRYLGNIFCIVFKNLQFPNTS